MVGLGCRLTISKRCCMLLEARACPSPLVLQEDGHSAGNCSHYFPNAASLSQMTKLPLGLLLEKTQQAAKSLQDFFFLESWMLLTTP